MNGKVQYSSPQCLTHPCLDKGITTARLLAKGLLGAKYDKDDNGKLDYAELKIMMRETFERVKEDGDVEDRD